MKIIIQFTYENTESGQPGPSEMFLLGFKKKKKNPIAKQMWLCGVLGYCRRAGRRRLLLKVFIIQ